jgi:hypothetical protein
MPVLGDSPLAFTPIVTPIVLSRGVITRSFGFFNAFNTAAALTDRDLTTPWEFNHTTQPEPAWIEFDFGYDVQLYAIHFIKQSGHLGDFNLVGSSNPATNQTDAYVAANGDELLTGFQDRVDSDFNALCSFLRKHRYYRILYPVSAFTLGGPPPDNLPVFEEIAFDAGIVASAFGFTTQAGKFSDMVDGNALSGWTPAATSLLGFNGLRGRAYPDVVFEADDRPCLQFDMGTPVALKDFTFQTATSTTIGSACLYGSNKVANDTSGALQVGDVKIGTYTRAQLNGGSPLTTSTAYTGEKYRFYRFVFISDAVVGDSGPDGTAILEFTSTPVTDTFFINSDYDSIWGRGDRIANGLITATESGLGTVFQGAATAFDNSYGHAAGNGPFYGGGSPLAAGGYFSFATSSSVVLNALRWVGSDHVEVEAGFAHFWTLRGGAAHGLTFDITSPAFTEFNISTSAFGNDFVQEVLCDSEIPFPYYEITFANTENASIGRFANELWLKVSHSELDGGDRRNIGGLTPRKEVIVTTSLTVSGGGVISDLVSGRFISANRGVSAGEDPTTNVTLSAATAGDYIKFEFPRNVGMQEMVLQTNTQEVYSSGNPTKYGTWKWQGSNDNSTWVDVGIPWKFKDGCNYMLAPNVNTTNSQYQLWRMVLITGPAFGATPTLYQFVFNLEDSQNQGTGLRVGFNEDQQTNVDVTATIQLNDAYSPAFTDDVDDQFLATVTLSPVLLLQADYTDDGDLEMFSEIFPSTVSQTILHCTGR